MRGANSAVGPFYCPADSKVYIDLSFFDELQRRFKAPGEFAQAYVIAHEVGHHVQNLLGTSERINAQRRRASKAEANALSVRMELQADFYAGVWANHIQRMRNVLEPGDIESGLRSRDGDRRRQDPDASAGLHRPRRLHPRHLRPARPVVHQGLQDRRRPSERHIQDGRFMILN